MVTLRHPLNPWIPEDLWRSVMSPQAPWVSPGYPGIAWGYPGNLRDLQRSSEIQGFRGCLRVTMAIGVFSDVRSPLPINPAHQPSLSVNLGFTAASHQLLEVFLTSKQTQIWAKVVQIIFYLIIVFCRRNLRTAEKIDLHFPSKKGLNLLRNGVGRDQPSRYRVHRL